VKPVRTPTTNTVLGAPRDWSPEDGVCEGLPIAVSEGITYSYWKPSPIEVLHILRGRPIRLAVYGRGHPPVALDTEL
jgi:hypothetical protein